MGAFECERGKGRERSEESDEQDRQIWFHGKETIFEQDEQESRQKRSQQIHGQSCEGERSGEARQQTGSGETADDIGKSVAYLGEETAYASGDIIIFTLNDKKVASPLFLAYYLNTIGRKQLNRLGEGQSIVHIYPEELSKVSVPCPSTEEQQKIVEVLETWDKAIQLTRELIEQKELQKKYSEVESKLYDSWQMDQILTK